MEHGIYNTGDDLLTALASTPRDERHQLLAAQGTRVLAEALDLCGTDAEGLGRATLIGAIMRDFG